MNERRAHIRVPVGIEGTYQLLGDLSGPRLGVTEDISLGGSRLSSAQCLQPGDAVAVELKLPEQGPLSMTGVVVWSRERGEPGQRNFESGLRWSSIDTRTQARLNAFVTATTCARSLVISSGGVLPRPVRWLRSVALALALFAAGCFLAAQWMERRRLLAEVQSLRQTVGMYREIVRSIPR